MSKNPHVAAKFSCNRKAGQAFETRTGIATLTWNAPEP